MNKIKKHLAKQVCYLLFEFYSLDSKGSQNEEWVDTVARTYPIMKKSIFRLSVAVLLSAM